VEDVDVEARTRTTSNTSEGRNNWFAYGISIPSNLFLGYIGVFSCAIILNLFNNTILVSLNISQENSVFSDSQNLATLVAIIFLAIMTPLFGLINWFAWRRPPTSSGKYWTVALLSLSAPSLLVIFWDDAWNTIGW
jgi:hypothetical protein